MTSVKNADQGGFLPSFYRVPGRASFSEFTRASSLKLVRPAATARAHSRSRTACGGKYLTFCLTRAGGPEIHRGHGVSIGIPTALRDWWMGLSHEKNLLDLTPHDLVIGCGSGSLFSSFPRVPGRASFSEITRASSLKLVRPAATAGALSRSRTAYGGKYLTSCLTRVGGPEIRLCPCLAHSMRDAFHLEAVPLCIEMPVIRRGLGDCLDQAAVEGAGAGAGALFPLRFSSSPSVLQDSRSASRAFISSRQKRMPTSAARKTR